MLQDFDAEFPNPGAQAYVRGSAEPVRIIQRNADGTLLLSRSRAAFRRKPGTTGRASGTFREKLENLHPTENDALDAAATKPRRARRKANRQ